MSTPFKTTIFYNVTRASLKMPLVSLQIVYNMFNNLNKINQNGIVLIYHKAWWTHFRSWTLPTVTWLEGRIYKVFYVFLLDFSWFDVLNRVCLLICVGQYLRWFWCFVNYLSKTRFLLVSANVKKKRLLEEVSRCARKRRIEFLIFFFPLKTSSSIACACHVNLEIFFLEYNF